MEDCDAAFDRALHSVGEDGRFHKRYNFIFNFCLAVCGTMVYVNLVMALYEPKTWCHVPGRELTNYTLEEWKDITLPKERNSRGIDDYSPCQMYDKNPNEIVTNSTRKIACQYGHDYDTTWFKSTIVTSNDWVCEKQFYGITILSTVKIMEVMGGLIIGNLGDTIGRRPVFFIAFVCMSVGRLSMPFISHLYYVFMAAAILCALPSTSIAQSCVVTLMELSPPEDRAMIAQIQNFGYSVGICLLPILCWIFSEWDLYILISSAPLQLYIFLSIFLIESPRWLLARGRVADALKQLKYIAKVNRTRVSTEVTLMLQNCMVNKEKSYGVASLFSNLRMAKNTFLLIIVWMSSMTSYCTLYISVIGVDGNPFIYSFLQGLSEMPAYLLGRYFCDRFGRRFTCIGGLLLSIFGYIEVIRINDEKQIYYFVLIAIIRFGVCIGFYVVGLQGLEIYPTCVRQSAYSFGTTAGNIFAVVSPFLVYAGIAIDAKLPYMGLAGLAVLAMIAEIFLPETLYERLPDTLHEAKTFGKDQEYWRLPQRKTDPSILANIKIVKRQHSETLEMEPFT